MHNEAFVEQLTLDEGDVQALAKVAQERMTQQVGEAARLQQQIDEQQRLFHRQKQLVYAAPELEAELLADMRRAKQELAALQARLEDLRAVEAPSAPALKFAERAVGFVERIRATFADWPRPARARVLALALADGVLGRVDRQHWGLWLQWRGGAESRKAIASRYGLRVVWTEDEQELLRRWYTLLTQDALMAMFPGRSWRSIKKVGSRLGLSREHLDPAHLVGIVPTTLPAPTVTNTMAAYGFSAPISTEPVDGDTHPVRPLAARRRASGRWRRCPGRSSLRSRRWRAGWPRPASRTSLPG